MNEPNPAEMSFRDLRIHERKKDFQRYIRGETRWVFRYYRSTYDGRIWWDLKLPFRGTNRDCVTGQYRNGQKILRYCGSLGFRVTEFFS